MRTPTWEDFSAQWAESSDKAMSHKRQLLDRGAALARAKTASAKRELARAVAAGASPERITSLRAHAEHLAARAGLLNVSVRRALYRDKAGPIPLGKAMAYGRVIDPAGGGVAGVKVRLTAAEARTAEERAAQATPPVMRRANNGPRGPPGPAMSHAARSHGHPLPDALVDAYRQAWSEDFGGVVVHTDAAAVCAARLFCADAFALGDHVFFGAGRYAPDSAPGAELLAHELAHVVQYRRGALDVARPVSAPEDQAERAADAYVARMPAAVPVEVADPAIHGARGPPALDRTAPVLRRATDGARTFFGQGYFQQAAGWSGATTGVDAELAADAAADAEALPDPTAALGPQQAPERPTPPAAPALAVAGEIPLPDESAAATPETEAETEATPPSLPAPPALS